MIAQKTLNIVLEALAGRLAAWLRSPRPVPLPPRIETNPDAVRARAAALDLAEFGRLLATGNPDDLKKIAKAMTRPDRVA